MKTGIQTRLLAIIALATLMPLALAVLAIQTVGYRHLVKERGTAFQAGAAHIAESINLLARAQVHQLRDFVTLGMPGSYTIEANQLLHSLSQAELEDQIRRMEERWPNLSPEQPEIAGFLTNALARELQKYQKRHPICAEILCTDRKGRLIASTGKTSDYWQADEDWWQQAAQLKPGQAWLEGLHFDESSATFALDVSIPVLAPEGEVAGILKASLNPLPLFSSVLPVLPERDLTRDIVRQDGSVLLRLGDAGFIPGSLKLDSKLAETLRSRSAGWVVRRLMGDGKSLVGFAALHIQTARGKDPLTTGVAPMFVIVHEPAWQALIPLRTQVTLLTFAGAGLVLIFGAAGLWVANRRIIGPIELLRSAAKAVAATVQPAGSAADSTQTWEASGQLDRLNCICTRDELESLARDFRVMGQRVLRYQQQLEEDITVKTAAIQRDLDMAREFQTALMPNLYPAVPDGDGPDELSLSFHHIYKPALTVGGDFFDVLKLSEHQAGIFIADVMGHGARSALVTAILRTLLQTYAKEADDPAALLSVVNQQFYQLTNRTQQTMFVTAFYMVADTLDRKLTCASAGHPSPLLAHRSNGTVEPLFSRLKDNPALGLFPSPHYSTHSHPLLPGDLVVLFTDGVLEAVNASGEEFGTSGLVEVVKKNLGGSDDSVINAINKSLTRFVGPTQFADDICLVTLDIRERKASPQSRPVPNSQAAAMSL